MQSQLSPPALVFVIAIVTTLIVRLRNRPPVVTNSSPSNIQNIKVLIAVPSFEDWNSILWNCVRSSLYPQQVTFRVLIECSSIHDAELDIDPILRPCVRVDYGVKKYVNVPERRVRRLTRRFLTHDESLVVVLDYRAVLRPSWDLSITSLCEELSNNSILSTPAATGHTVGHFPCLSSSDDGVRRVKSLPFHMAEAELLPSVCWCPELTIGRPAAFAEWTATGPLSSTLLLTTPTPLLINNPTLENVFIQSQQSCTVVYKTHHSIGLADPHNNREAIIKFGSTRAAKLATRFGYKHLLIS